MRRYDSETRETIHLAVPEARGIRLVERMDSKHPLRLVQPVGTRSPLHASSTGKAMLAHAREQPVGVGRNPLRRSASRRPYRQGTSRCRIAQTRQRPSRQPCDPHQSGTSHRLVSTSTSHADRPPCSRLTDERRDSPSHSSTSAGPDPFECASDLDNSSVISASVLGHGHLPPRLRPLAVASSFSGSAVVT